MEHLLLKMARQIDALDEASLLALWEKYAMLVSRFEPTKRWEEAALVFALIQAKHWKNQLFNYNWSAQVRPSDNAGADSPMPPAFALDWPREGDIPENAPRAKVIPFQPRTPAEQAPAEATPPVPTDSSDPDPKPEA